MSEENHEAGPSLQGTIRLILATIVIATIWLVVLPWIAEFPSIRDRSDRLEAAGIDPSAMFYTELPMMEPILERLERRR
ncbi:MAG: hypothetical protein R3C19_23045 [Planctomycetaceae bacterium]